MLLLVAACSSNSEYGDRLKKTGNTSIEMPGTDGAAMATEAPDSLVPATTPISEVSTVAPIEPPNSLVGGASVVCLHSVGERCAWELTLPVDPGCNAQTASSERVFALLPCEYSYWIGFLEAKLTTLGVRVTKDGYYASYEVDLIKAAQRKLGVGDDGLIGTKTWRAAFSEIDCSLFDFNSGQPEYMRDCYYDTNGDGMYGPGDDIAD